MPLGFYISVPFCRSKCSYCNFASGVFSKGAYEAYVARVIQDIENSRQMATQMGCNLSETIDSIYLGGGTPSILEREQLIRIFGSLRTEFDLDPRAEITVECAPGTLTPEITETLAECGVNRVSLGVQSFVDEEAKAIGRLHKREIVIQDIARLREAGITNLNVDLIAGLPHQTRETWEFSVNEAIAASAPHISVYMLEVDEDSRLGRELIAGGTRYHAHHVPDDDKTADFYLRACDVLNGAGIEQYEISNFSCAGYESQHNLKYWNRRPYLGCGVDAHSMLPAKIGGDTTAVRFSMPDSLDAYMRNDPPTVTPVTRQAALEESFFLGLRLNDGIDLNRLRAEFGAASLAACHSVIDDGINDGLLEMKNDKLRLTERGRLVSNEVFERFLVGAESAAEARSLSAG
jgi:oxygen-independent coproporphyrinogen III oxidase